LTDFTPARLHRWVVAVGRPGVNHVARADRGLECLGVVAMRGILHRIQMIEITKEFIEAVDGRQKLVEITEVVLAELTGGISHGFEGRGDGRRLGWHADWRARLAHGGKPRPDR